MELLFVIFNRAFRQDTALKSKGGGRTGVYDLPPSVTYPFHCRAAVSSPRTVHFAEVVSGKQEGAVSNHSTLKVCHGAVQQTVLRSIPKTCYLYFFFFFFSPPVLLILNCAFSEEKL
uniref:Uncharacterized protein n=1 Tax=Cacopsylla melanoneura TaxID=428564 RepID=A0A8D9AKZ8_9HEMI